MVAVDDLGLPHLDGLLRDLEPADGPGIEGADAALDGDGLHGPVDARLFLGELLGIVGQRIVLRLGGGFTGGHGAQGIDQRLRAQLGQLVIEAGGGLIKGDGAAHLADHGAGIQPHIHLHYGDAGFGIARPDGALYGGGTAPAWQQGAVHIEATETRGVEHRLGQDQAVGHHHHEIGAKGGQFGLCGFIAQGGRLVDRQAVGQRQLLDRAGGQFLTAARRLVGLGVNGDDFMVGRQQRRQMTGGEVGGTGKNQFQLIQWGRSSEDFAIFTGHLFQLLTDALALERGQVIHKQLADQMIHLMLYADGEQIVRFQLEWLAVAIQRPDLDPLGTRYQSAAAGDREATLFDAGAA